VCELHPSGLERAPQIEDLPHDVAEVIQDESASTWLRANLFNAVAKRDPLDALHDAQALATALQSWAQHVFRLHGMELPI
jgi:hypothetical protein